MYIPIALNKESREPIYHQIEQQLQTLIASGFLAPGNALPSIRVLAKELEISVITTRRAYQNLEASGFIETKQGKGTFVREVPGDIKERVKSENVIESMQEAVHIAHTYDYTEEEMLVLFTQAMKAYFDEKKGESS
ncbi:MAG TPA: GntR family transcriptional regulator [Bacillota bacterium]|nr:GntR family transcriptional regulator [Bacillota bacterium]